MTSKNFLLSFCVFFESLFIGQQSEKRLVWSFVRFICEGVLIFHITLLASPIWYRGLFISYKISYIPYLPTQFLYSSPLLNFKYSNLPITLLPLFSIFSSNSSKNQVSCHAAFKFFHSYKIPVINTIMNYFHIFQKNE